MQPLKLLRNYSFVPIAVETFVSWGPLGLNFIKEIGRKIKESTKDKNIISHDKEEPISKVIFLPCHCIDMNFNFKYIQRVLPLLCIFWFWEKIALAKYLPYAIFGYFISLLRFALCKFWSVLFHQCKFLTIYGPKIAVMK